MKIPDSLQRLHTDILAEMLSNISDDIDKTEGSFIYDSLAPVSIELAILYKELIEILKRAFVQSSYDEYLDYLGEQFGVTRKREAKATGTVLFTGETNTVIPSGLLISTTGDSMSEPVEFITVEQAVIGASGQAYVKVEALNGGAKGNVPVNTINMICNYINGLSAVINETPTSGGADIENDDDYRERILEKVKEYITGGSKADYKRWALEVEGVGNASVEPAKYGAGTVSVAILDSSLNLPSDELVKDVEDYIAPKWIYEYEAENFTKSGYGVSNEDLPDDIGESAKFQYDSQGEGAIKRGLTFDSQGLWTARIRVKVDDNTGGNNLLQIGIWDIDNGEWAKTSVFNESPAVKILKASDMETSFRYIDIPFLYNGNNLEIRITRLIDDVTTIVWVDRISITSNFCKDTGEGKAPIGAKVYIEKPTEVLIDIYSLVTLKAGYNIDNVKANFRNKVEEYLKSLTFKEENDVIYVRIGYLLLETEGIKTYTGLLVNGDILDIPIGTQEIAKLGTITLVQ